MPRHILPILFVLLVAACGENTPPEQASETASACGSQHQDAIVASKAWVRAAGEGRMMSAAYLTLCNAGDSADKLLRVSTDIAEAAEIHQTSRDEAGVTSMAPVDFVALPPHQDVALAPGGAHIMLIGLSGPIEPGDTVALTLYFENNPAQTLEFEARALGGAQN